MALETSKTSAPFLRMPKQVTFAGTLIDTARDFIGCKEDVGRANRSKCVDEIHSYNGGEITNDPWCAKFATMVLDMSLKLFKRANEIGITYGTSTLLAKAKKYGLRVDNNPAVGSIFYYKTKTGGHVGYVANYKDGRLITIEGNMSDKVGWGNRGILDKQYQFIHTEELVADTISNGAIKNIAIATGVTGLLGVGGYFAWQKFK